MEAFYDMKQLKLYARQHGSHFFDPDTMRFFRSRVGDKMYPAPDGIYFVTSEQYDASSPRLYTVRFMNEKGDISTIGEFQGYATGKAAAREAKRLQHTSTRVERAMSKVEQARRKTRFGNRRPDVPVRRHMRRK